MKKQKLVMVGNGMAGCRTLEELLKIAPDLYDITVFGAEPHGNYNRILLSPVLAGEMTLPDIVLNDFDWYREHGITLHAGKAVTQIDRVRRTVTAADGTVAEYDRLLLATGSTPFIPPIPGNDLPGVLGYRDIADTEAMIAAAEDLGLDPATAQRMVHHTILGAATLLESSGETAQTLRRNVTSPNGTTAAAISTMEELGVHQAVVAAIAAAHDRSRELSGG